MTKTEELMDIVADYASEVADIATSEAAFAHVWKSRYAYRDKTLAELKSAIEELVADAEKMALEIQDVSKFLKNVMTKYEHKIVEEFADGYYSCALATLNRMYELNKMADAAMKETP